MVSRSGYDLAVIGGGPGGSTAAALGRKLGWRVLVAEKERFPRFRIGESLLPAGNQILRESGAWTRVEAAGFFPKFGATFVLGDGSAAREVWFRDGLVPGLESTFQVERSRFDHLLLDHARELGADVRLETRAEPAGEGPQGHRLRLVSAGGSEEITARWLIDAGGRNPAGGLGGKAGLDPLPLPRRVAIYSHFSGVARASGPAAGHTVVVRLEEGWFWLIPVDAERTSAGLVTSAESIRRSGRSPEEAFERAVAGSAKLSELFAGALRQRPFETTGDYSYFHRSLAGPRFLRVGDAAGFLDPIFSSGVYASLWSARLAVDTAARADRAGRELTRGERRSYTRGVKGHARPFLRLIAAFYDNRCFEVIMAPDIPFDLRPGLWSVVAGHARLDWPLWWRFHAFLLACRLQKWGVPLAPRIRHPARAAGSHPPAAASAPTGAGGCGSAQR